MYMLQKKTLVVVELETYAGLPSPYDGWKRLQRNEKWINL